MAFTKVTDNLLSSGVGTGAGNILELDSSGKLPAVDGSNLTGGSTQADNVKAKFGGGEDLQIYHSGSHAIIKNSTGNLRILADVFEVNKADNSEATIYGVADGAVSLYHDNTKKFETIAGGVRIPSGGLLFGTDTAAANALDDYEEGTWTPVITAYTGTNPTIGGNSDGKYTKIGNMVTIHFNFNSLTASGTTSGILQVSLPFTASGDWTGALCSNEMTFVRPENTSWINIGTTNVGILSSSNGGSWGWELVSIIDAGGVGALRGSLSYRAA